MTDSFFKNFQNFKVENVYLPAIGDRNSEDLRQYSNSSTVFPSDIYINFLRQASIQKKIGAGVEYVECSAAIDLFDDTGDVRFLLGIFYRDDVKVN